MITTSKLIDLGIHAKSKVLVVMPHPDDETVFIGGLLNCLSQNHIQTRVLTMTKGEKSTLRHGVQPGQDLGVARKIELSNALHIFGVNNFNILDFPDGGLKNKEKQICEVIKKCISSFYPTHVITLEPDGIYGHPDHVALSLFVRKTVQKPTRLLYATISQHHILPSAKHMAEKDKIVPILPDVKFSFPLSGSVAKLKALKAHSSQFPITLRKTPLDLLFFFMNQLLTNEFYAFGN